MHRTLYTVQKATFCTEVYGASGHWMYSGCCMYCNQHSNAYVKVVYCLGFGNKKSWQYWYVANTSIYIVMYVFLYVYNYVLKMYKHWG